MAWEDHKRWWFPSLLLTPATSAGPQILREHQVRNSHIATRKPLQTGITEELIMLFQFCWVFTIFGKSAQTVRPFLIMVSHFHIYFVCALNIASATHIFFRSSQKCSDIEKLKKQLMQLLVTISPANNNHSTPSNVVVVTMMPQQWQWQWRWQWQWWWQ